VRSIGRLKYSTGLAAWRARVKNRASRQRGIRRCS